MLGKPGESRGRGNSLPISSPGADPAPGAASPLPSPAFPRSEPHPCSGYSVSGEACKEWGTEQDDRRRQSWTLSASRLEALVTRCHRIFGEINASAGVFPIPRSCSHSTLQTRHPLLRPRGLRLHPPVSAERPGAGLTRSPGRRCCREPAQLASGFSWEHKQAHKMSHRTGSTVTSVGHEKKEAACVHAWTQTGRGPGPGHQTPDAPLLAGRGGWASSPTGGQRGLVFLLQGRSSEMHSAESPPLPQTPRPAPALLSRPLPKAARQSRVPWLPSPVPC